MYEYEDAWTYLLQMQPMFGTITLNQTKQNNETKKCLEIWKIN